MYLPGISGKSGIGLYVSGGCVTKKQALQVVESAKSGEVQSLLKFLKIIDALRSQGFNYIKTAKLLAFDDVRDFESLIIDAEDRFPEL